MPASRSAGLPDAAGTRDGGGVNGAEAWEVAAQIASDPISGDQTSAGLPKRVPRANLIPGSAQDGGDSNGGGQGIPGSGPGGNRVGGGGRIGGQPMTSQQESYPGQPPAAARPRTPDMARSRLSGFQRGTRRAQGQRPAGEGADR